jgi:hypothetical protein
LKYFFALFLSLAFGLNPTSSPAQPADFIEIGQANGVTYHRSERPFIDQSEWFVFAKNQNGGTELMMLRTQGCDSSVSHKKFYKNMYTKKNSSIELAKADEGLLLIHERLCAAQKSQKSGGLMASGSESEDFKEIPKDIAYSKDGPFHVIKPVAKHNTAHQSIQNTLRIASELCLAANKKIWLEESSWLADYGFFSEKYTSSAKFYCHSTGGSDYSEPYSEGDIHVVPGVFGTLSVLDTKGFIKRTDDHLFPKVATSYCDKKQMKMVVSPTNLDGIWPFSGYQFFCTR